MNAQADLRKEWLEEAYLLGVAERSTEPADRPTADEVALEVIDLNAYGSMSWGELADIQNAIVEEYERGISENAENHGTT